MNTPTFDCSICKGNYSVRMTYYRGRNICGWCGYEIEFGGPTTDFKKLVKNLPKTSELLGFFIHSLFGGNGKPVLGSI